MGFRFQLNESVPDGVRRIVTEELGSMISDLERATPSTRDKSIHEARKSLKKLRAILRLMRRELGDTYELENRVFRNAGRTLSDLRDSASVIESFGTLERKYKEELPAFALESVRRGLLEKKRQAEKEHDLSALLKDVAFSLRATARRVDSWPLSKDGLAALEPGVEDAYRKGKAAFQAAQKESSTDNYHEWRKRVKDHWYHVRLLENLWTEVFQGYEAVLKEVETCLGEDHNLAILRELLLNEPRLFGGRRSVNHLLPIIKREQKELRAKADAFGQRMYDEKPKRFVKGLRHLWDEWRVEGGKRKTGKKALARAA